MNVPRPEKLEFIRWFAERLAEAGNPPRLKHAMAAFPTVPRATLAEWIKTEIAKLMKPVSDEEAQGLLTPAIPQSAPIDYLARLTALLARTDEVRRMGYNSDGKPRNPRLIMEAHRQELHILSTGARVNQMVRDAQRYEEFIGALVGCVLEEAPSVRDRIIAKMEAHKARFIAAEAADKRL